MRSIAALLLLLAAALVPPLKLTADDKVKSSDYLPLKEGMKWHYQVEGNGVKVQLITQVAKIESINGQPLARVETVANGMVVASEHLSTTPRGIFRHRFNGVEVSPPVCVLKYPVKNGASWESENKIGEKKAKMNCRVGNEEVEVPAGKYKAVTVQVDAEVEGIKLTTTYWFAAGVGIVKQIVEFGGRKTTMVLEKIERGN